MKMITIPKLFRSTIVGTALLFGLIAIVTSLLFGVILHRIMFAEFENRGRAITTGIATSSVELILNRDASTLQATIDQFIDPQGGVGYVFVVDNHSRIIAHTFVPGVPEELLAYREDSESQGFTRSVRLSGRGNFLDVVSPVLFGAAGYVHVGMDTSVITAQIRSAILIQSALLFVMFFIAIIVTIVQNNRIARPIVQLTEYAAAVAANPIALTQRPIGAELQPVAKRDDELGQLVASFERMVQEVDERERRLERRNLAIETSSEVSRRLASLLDPAQLVIGIVNQVQQAFNYYHVHIYMFDATGNYLVMAGGTGEAGQALLRKGHRILRGRGLVGRAATTNSVVLVSDVNQEKGWLPNPLLPDTKSEIAVPIAVSDRVLGVLDVQQDRVGSLTEEDARLLQSIANQAAVALRNAGLYEQAKKQADREAALNLIGQNIQAAPDIESVLRIAAKELGQALGAEQTSVQLSNPGAPISARSFNGGRPTDGSRLPVEKLT